MKISDESYDQIGVGYSNQRRPDDRIGRYIQSALADALSVLNVGAGAGSYEPLHVPTTAIEPSFEMIRQRQNKRNVIQASAETLPIQDDAFDATLAVLTIHHWSNLISGLEECARCSRRKVVILTWNPDSAGFWLTQEYFPELLEHDQRIFPSVKRLQGCLGSVQVKSVPIPADCVDAFLGAFWRRPKAYLDSEIRAVMSSFSKIPDFPDRLKQLQKDLSSGMWYREHSKFLSQDSCDLGYIVVTAELH